MQPWIYGPIRYKCVCHWCWRTKPQAATATTAPTATPRYTEKNWPLGQKAYEPHSKPRKVRSGYFPQSGLWHLVSPIEYTIAIKKNHDFFSFEFSADFPSIARAKKWWSCRAAPVSSMVVQFWPAHSTCSGLCWFMHRERARFIGIRECASISPPNIFTFDIIGFLQLQNSSESQNEKHFHRMLLSCSVWPLETAKLTRLRTLTAFELRPFTRCRGLSTTTKITRKTAHLFRFSVNSIALVRP